MPLLFLIVGVLFLVAAVRGEEQTKLLISTVKSDFTGPGNFFVWALAIGSVAALGTVPRLKSFSNVFLGLIFVVLILAKKDSTGQDFFTSFFSQIRSTESTKPAATANKPVVSSLPALPSLADIMSSLKGSAK